MFDIRKIQEKTIFDAVKNASNETIAKNIVHGSKEQDNASWVKSTMEKLDAQFDRKTVKDIRSNCQCGYGMDDKYDLVKYIFHRTNSLEELGMNKDANDAGLHFTNDVLYLEFPFCPCPMLADVDKLDSDTWCQCTTGYSKVLFEKVFKCEVTVVLLKSVKMGDEKCLMSIEPEIDPWSKIKG